MLKTGISASFLVILLLSSGSFTSEVHDSANIVTGEEDVFTTLLSHLLTKRDVKSNDGVELSDSETLVDSTDELEESDIRPKRSNVEKALKADIFDPVKIKRDSHMSKYRRPKTLFRPVREAQRLKTYGEVEEKLRAKRDVLRPKVQSEILQSLRPKRGGLRPKVQSEILQSLRPKRGGLRPKIENEHSERLRTKREPLRPKIISEAFGVLRPKRRDLTQFRDERIRPKRKDFGPLFGDEAFGNMRPKRTVQGRQV